MLRRVTETGEIDEEWQLTNTHHGQFCCYCPAIRQCKCHDTDETESNSLMEIPEKPCEECAPFVKANIGSSKFQGIRGDLNNLMGVTMINTLIDVLHGYMRGTGINSNFFKK